MQPGIDFDTGEDYEFNTCTLKFGNIYFDESGGSFEHHDVCQSD